MSLAENLASRRPRLRWLSTDGVSSTGEAVRENARATAGPNTTFAPPTPTPERAACRGATSRRWSSPERWPDSPRVLVADNPTWGLDVGAIDYVHLKLLEMRDRVERCC